MPYSVGLWSVWRPSIYLNVADYDLENIPNLSLSFTIIDDY